MFWKVGRTGAMTTPPACLPCATVCLLLPPDLGSTYPRIMPVETYPDQLEPENQAVVIWRFMRMDKFRDLIETSKLYFCRADKFNDEHEGLPPEKYLCSCLGLNPLLLSDRRTLDHDLGTLAQFREGFYVSCWHLFRDETDKMWKEYGDDGVAICSRYCLLKSALNAMGDQAFLGLVRYGEKNLKKYNLLQFIMTKREKYKNEREARAMLWIRDPHAGINRHFDIENRPHRLPLTPPPGSVLPGHKRSVDLQTLITPIVVTPWASPASLNEVNRLVDSNGYTIPVQPSGLTRYRDLLPST
jgi:hypothetical protein